MSDFKLYSYEEFCKNVLEKRATAELSQEEVNESMLKNLAMAAAMAVGTFAGPKGYAATAPSNHNIDSEPANTEMTSTGVHDGPSGSTVKTGPAAIEQALNKLEHRKMFKMHYNGDKSAIIGIGQYDYPIFREGSKELAAYNAAMIGAKSSTEKFFWANGLVYANPAVVTSEEAAKDEVQIASTEGTSTSVEPVVNPVAVAPVHATDTQERGHIKLKMSDISSFVVKAQGLWDLRAKGGSLEVKVDGVPRTYHDKNTFVTDYVSVEYPQFAKARFNQVVQGDEVRALIADAISRVGQ